MGKLLPRLNQYLLKAQEDFEGIDGIKKGIINNVAESISHAIKENHKASVMFVCTHNSRRSIFSQIWAQVAAYCYDVPGFEAFSGGTEATAFYPGAVKTLEDCGFEIDKASIGRNPVYKVWYAPSAPPLHICSKKFDARENPKNNFIAIVNCSSADESCPIIPGAKSRYKLLYQDPKIADGTPEESKTYAERSYQIARNMSYMLTQCHIAIKAREALKV